MRVEQSGATPVANSLPSVMLTVLAGGVGSWGLANGYVTIAGTDYAPVLRTWAICTAASVLLLLVAATIGSKWARIAALALVAGLAIAGADPAQRTLALWQAGELF